MCLKLAPTKVSPNLGKKIVKTTIFAKKRACDVLRRPATFSATPATFSATSCDVFCDALRRPATPCDVFWRFLADFVIFGHVLPIFWKIRENVPKFQVSCLVSPSFDENLDKEVYGQDCVAARSGRIKLSLFDDVFVQFHDRIPNLHHFSLQKAPLAVISVKFRQHVQANVFYPGLLDLSQ